MEQYRCEFEEFYATARDHCLQVVLVSVGDRNLAEDLVAEAFTKAWASWRKVRGHPAPLAWVVRTALNLHVSWWRRRRREVALGGQDKAAAASQYPGLDNSLVAVLRRLPVKQREVIVLRLLLDLDTATTAQTLGAHQMNDTKLANAVKSGLTEACDSLSAVHLAIPASEIMARADKTRRRRVGALAGAGGLAAVGVAASVALPASHPASHPVASHPAASHPVASHPVASQPATGPAIQLAAWTVTRQADGNIQVTFREAADQARLQHTLRADGVPASVTFTGQQNPACHLIAGPVGNVFDGSRFAGNPKEAYETPDALVIRPSALPSGDGVEIWTSGTPGAAGNFQLQMSLVQASPQCTGS